MEVMGISKVSFLTTNGPAETYLYDRDIVVSDGRFESKEGEREVLGDSWKVRN